MTTIAVPATSDLSRARHGVPFSRTLTVEFRKAVDTRASRVLLGVALGATVALSVVVGLFHRQLLGTTAIATAWTGSIGFAGFVLSMLLPVVVILLVTTEWSQRTALTTFTSEPRRGRVVLAKALVALGMFVACEVLRYGLSAAASGIAAARGASIDWSLNWSYLAGSIITELISMMVAFGFALALCNSPAAIVTYMALPSLFAMLSLVPGLKSTIKWVSVQNASVPLATGEWTMHDVWPLLSAAAIWAGIPTAIGVLRHLRREIS